MDQDQVSNTQPHLKCTLPSKDMSMKYNIKYKIQYQNTKIQNTILTSKIGSKKDPFKQYQFKK